MRVMMITMSMRVMTMDMVMSIMMIPRMYTMTHLFVGRARRPAHRRSVFAITHLFIGKANRHASLLRNIRTIPLTQFLG